MTVVCYNTALKLFYTLCTETKTASNMLIGPKTKEFHIRTQRRPEVKHHLVWSSQGGPQKADPVR